MFQGIKDSIQLINKCILMSGLVTCFLLIYIMLLSSFFTGTWVSVLYFNQVGEGYIELAILTYVFILFFIYGKQMLWRLTDR